MSHKLTRVSTAMGQIHRHSNIGAGLIALSVGCSSLLAAVPPAFAPPLVAGQPQLWTLPIADRTTPFPTLSAVQIDRQLGLYQQFLAQHGTPDILIIGSSRSLQGIDPVALQQQLADQGYPDLKIFNLGMNGATAQVEQVLLESVLLESVFPQQPMAQPPKLIVWGDGARAFNQGRKDITHQKLQTAPGLAALKAGQRPILVPDLQGPTIGDQREALGLQIVREVFVPEQYFQRFAKIPGAYDRDYRDFALDGAQAAATERLLQRVQQQQIPIVFVNLPLTDIYLDTDRQRYEVSFREFQQDLVAQGKLTRFIDLGQAWPNRYDRFADPSHINQQGAQAVGERLGRELGGDPAFRQWIAK